MKKIAHYEVDQSNKIEQTERDTVLAISNGTKFSVVLTRHSKRKIQAIYRDLGEPKVFIYFVFAALLSIVVRHSGTSSRIIVDREYLDHEDLIKLTGYSIRNRGLLNFGLNTDDRQPSRSIFEL